MVGSALAAFQKAAPVMENPPKVVTITIGVDGTISDKDITISTGTTVKWVGLNATSNRGVVPTTANNWTPQAYRESDPDEFTGPMPNAPGGIFVMSPNPDGKELGFQEVKPNNVLGHFEQAMCPIMVNSEGDHTSSFAASAPTGEALCNSGEVQHVMPDTWKDPAISGVLIRLAWNLMYKAPPKIASSSDGGKVFVYDYNFSDLDREAENAVSNGKLYTIAIEAGRQGTPDWIFNTPDPEIPPIPNRVEGGVPRLIFQNGGDGDPESRDEDGCGATMSLGLPQDVYYKKHYFAMLNAVATHLKENAARYRALAYVKISGANLYTDENRLPNQCREGCVCNPEVWAKNGYTPTGMKQFYKEQEETLMAAFPTKSFIYPLIQAGFPLVDDDHVWMGVDGQWYQQKFLGLGPLHYDVVVSNHPQVDAVETTEDILAEGELLLGTRFIRQHCGLQIIQSHDCLSKTSEPGCPNKLVIKAPPPKITVLQTQNTKEIVTPVDLDGALQNGYLNSYATMIEVYEQIRWLADKNPGTLNPSSPLPQTLSDWDNRYNNRRDELQFSPFVIPNGPAGSTHEFTFTSSGKTLYYMISGTSGPDTKGSITILPVPKKGVNTSPSLGVP
jgi:hypothetical protein